MDEQRLKRFDRHIVLDQIGLSGQIRFSKSVVSVIGAGGLGSPALLYLVAAGIGEIRIIDDDEVDISNLQRQILHSEKDVGVKKVDSALERMSKIDSTVKIKIFKQKLTPENATGLISGSDVVVDGTDNFDARYALNDACEALGIPWVFASVLRFEGQVSVFNYQDGPNYRDLFPQPPPPALAPNCSEAGILGSMTGIIGSIQATEAMKVLLGIEGVLSGRLLIFNALKMESRILKFSSTRGKTNSNFSKPKIDMKITPKELERMILGGDEVFILDVRREIEESIASINGTSARIEHLQIPSRIEELPRDLPLIVYCHSGVRSAAVVNYLSSLDDFNGAISNLEGGIDRWSREVDPNIPRY